MYEAEELVGKTYHIKTFGCQMNLHDSERVRGLLDVCGCNEVESTDDADIVIFMTCSVRENADQRLYGIRYGQRSHASVGKARCCHWRMHCAT